MGSFSIWHWLIVLVIVVLVFGTKKLRNMGGDVGGAVKNFKDAVKEGGESLAAPVAAVVEPKAVKTPASIKAPAKPKAAASAAKKPAAEKPAAKKPAVKKAVAKKPAAKKPAAKKPAAKKSAAQ